MSITSTYSNGYNVKQVMLALLNRRRWRQPTRSGFLGTLTGSNVWSDAEDLLYAPTFDAVHKAVNPWSVWRTQPDDAITIANFNIYLQQLQTDCVLKCLNGVFNKAERLEKKLLFERFGRSDYPNTIFGVPGFCCVRILPAKDYGISCQIDSVALLFNEDVTFNMYLFHDTSPGVPLAAKSVSAVANSQTIVKFSQFILNYSELKKSGYFYFGYFQSDLGSAVATNEIIQEFNTMNYFGITPVEMQVVAPLVENGVQGININYLSFTVKSQGFNIQMSAFRDFTQLIVDCAYLFDEVVGLQMAADVIEMIQTTIRTNQDERITQELTAQLGKDLNLAEPSDANPYVSGLKVRITREINRVKNEFFPKAKPTTITHDTENSNIYGVPPPVLDAFSY